MISTSTEFVPFELERLLAVWENQIERNLSESGVHPMTMRELFAMQGDADAALARIAGVELNYPQSNGDPALRETIASLYPGAAAENVLVTIGAIQANFTTLMTVTQPGDDVAVMQPNYQQFWGLAQNTGRRAEHVRAQARARLGARPGRADRGREARHQAGHRGEPQQPDRPHHARERAAGGRRRRRRCGRVAARDEVYAGAERVTDEVTPTLYGEYDKVIAVGQHVEGLRPARSAPRLGRRARRPDRRACGRGRTTSPSPPPSSPTSLRRSRCLRACGRSFWSARAATCVAASRTCERWAAGRDDVEIFAPDAAAICFARYDKQIGSRDLVMRLLKEKSAFVAPGALFGLEHHLRISFGLPDDYVNEGLRRLGELLDEVE